MTTAHGRHSQSFAKKHPDVLDQVQGHEAGVDRAEGAVGGRVQVSAAQQGVTRETRPRFPIHADRGLRPRMLLARPFLPEGQDPQAKQQLLARKVHGEQSAGPSQCPAVASRGVDGNNCLGMHPFNSPGAGQGHPKASGVTSQKTPFKKLIRWPNLPPGASLPTLGAGNLVDDPVDTPGRGTVAEGANCLPGVLDGLLPSARMDNPSISQQPTFIDLFSGCGGLSLGLSSAGWKGLFAIERATDAFETFRANFLAKGVRHPFQWPAWLEQCAHSIDDVLERHDDELKELRGKVDLIAGGPPCQGFSFAGKRKSSDPRNKMFQRYVTFVDIIRPKFLILENVPGMNVAHTKQGAKTAKAGITYYDKLREALSALDYSVGEMILDASNFGVPQRRARLVVVGIHADLAKAMPTGCTGVFNEILQEGANQLSVYGGGALVSAEQAISDLVVGGDRGRTVEYTGFGARRGYVQLEYKGPSLPMYQRLMNQGVAPEQMDSMRIAHHKEDVEARFKKILSSCKRGVNLSHEDRRRLGMLKHRTVPMAPSLPAPTLTTLPDDILHYCEPRILTVRECARLQSFPDWFVFQGKYTTGGDRRKVECPRYTQVGNAVPPLLARAIGIGVIKSFHSAEGKVKSAIGKKRVIKKAAVMAGN